MPTTVSDMIHWSARRCAVIAFGETLDTAELADYFSLLNQIISSWSLQGDVSYIQKRSTFNLSAGTANYTMGSGGTWNNAKRPVRILGATGKSGSFQAPVECLPYSEYAKRTANGTGATAVLPSLIGYDTAAPLVNISVFPTPATSPGTVEVQFWEPLSQFTASSDNWPTWPAEGYDAGLLLELAIGISTMNGKAVPTELAADWNRSMQRMQSANLGMGVAPAPAQPQQ